MENKKLWFKAKNYGWGWYPVSWQGWLVIALYTMGLVPHIINASRQHSGSDFLIGFSIPFVINTVFLLIICYARGEKPRWRWGK